MEKRTLLCVAIACFALAGCAPMPRVGGEAPTSKECNGVRCEIDVTVVGNEIVVVDYALINNQRKPIVMLWRLPQDSPYTLKIEIIGGGDEFPGCMQNGPRQFMCNNTHTKSGVYKYWVKVDGPNHLEKDPYIVND
jgi:hypothetical protein